jgi:hypothetical protein
MDTILPHLPGLDADEMEDRLPPHPPPNASMPVTYEFDGRTVALRLTGVYETADVRAALRNALDDPRAPHTAGLLFDMRGSRSIAQRTAAEVRTMAQFIAAHGDRFGRRLALLADTDAAFGLMRLGAVTVEQQGVETSVFRDIADAEEWLGAARPG